MEITFGGLQTELVTVKACQNLFHESNVGFHSWSKDEDVVNIYDDASCPEDRVEQVVHDSLEGGRELQRPKYMTCGMKQLKGVRNAARNRSCGAI